MYVRLMIYLSFASLTFGSYCVVMKELLRSYGDDTASNWASILYYCPFNSHLTSI